MISLKCGKCGMVHNLTEDHVVGRGYGFYCPNCGEPLPSSLENAIFQFAKRVPEFNGWEAYILPPPEELRKLQL